MPQYDDDPMDEHLALPFAAEPHAPTSVLPADPRAVLAHVLQHLTTTFTSDDGGPLDRVLTTVAVLVTRWICHPFPLRMVIAGRSGVGKTRLLHAICEMTQVPGTILPVTQMAESSWHGLQLGEAVRTLFPDQFIARGINGRILGPSGVITQPCCLLIDEFDKLALVAPDGQPLDGAARAWRVGRQQTLLAALDPLSVVPTRLDDVDRAVTWSLAHSIVICAGAFSMFGADEVITPAKLAQIGIADELIDRAGVILTLPQPSAAARRQLATVAVDDMLAFACELDIEVRGIDSLLASLPAPGAADAPFRGVRGMRHHVERVIADAIATAIARSASVAYVASHDMGHA